MEDVFQKIVLWCVIHTHVIQCSIAVYSTIPVLYCSSSYHGVHRVCVLTFFLYCSTYVIHPKGGIYRIWKLSAKLGVSKFYTEQLWRMWYNLWSMANLMRTYFIVLFGCLDWHKLPQNCDLQCFVHMKFIVSTILGINCGCLIHIQRVV